MKRMGRWNKYEAYKTLESGKIRIDGNYNYRIESSWKMKNKKIWKYMKWKIFKNHWKDGCEETDDIEIYWEILITARA